MEEIDLKELFYYFLTKIRIVIIFILVCLLIGSLYTFLIQDDKYQSSSSVILVGASEEFGNNELSLNKNLVNTYAKVVKSKRILKRVISELNLDIKYEDLVQNVSVTNEADTQIINISIVNENNILACDITNKITEVFIEEIPQLYNLSNVNILDKAEIANKPFNKSVLKQLILFTAIGFILGGAIVFVMYYFDRTIKSTQQIEKNSKLSILGSVLEYKGDEK